MTGEINQDCYCSANALLVDKSIQYCKMASLKTGVGSSLCGIYCDDFLDCKNRHRKWPTLEQFCQEYGEEVPQGMPVWVNLDITGLNTSDWVLTKIATEFLSADRKVYYGQFRAHKVNAIVVACTPWGKPLSGWRPE